MRADCFPCLNSRSVKVSDKFVKEVHVVKYMVFKGREVITTFKGNYNQL